MSSTRAAWVPLSGAIKIAVAAANAPLIAHTMVETRRGEVPNTRAVSGLLAEARTASPNRVRVKNNPRAAIKTGTTSNTVSSRAWIRRSLVGSHVTSKAVGMEPPAVMSGIQLTRASNKICPTPIVAINNTRRGESKSRRTTTNSTTAPASAHPATASTNATHQLTS